jgi:hypothetical protein
MSWLTPENAGTATPCVRGPPSQSTVGLSSHLSPGPARPRLVRREQPWPGRARARFHISSGFPVAPMWRRLVGRGLVEDHACPIHMKHPSRQSRSCQLEDSQRWTTAASRLSCRGRSDASGLLATSPASTPPRCRARSRCWRGLASRVEQHDLFAQRAAILTLAPASGSVHEFLAIG